MTLAEKFNGLIRCGALTVVESLGEDIVIYKYFGLKIAIVDKDCNVLMTNTAIPGMDFNDLCAVNYVVGTLIKHYYLADEDWVHIDCAKEHIAETGMLYYLREKV